MTARTPEAVQDAANKLMGALALHEDCRDTVTDALHDMWDAGRDAAQQAQREADEARCIRTTGRAW